MYFSKPLFALLILPALAAVVSGAPKEPPAKERPKFEITTKRSNDVVKASIKNDEALLDITSPVGISNVEIKRPGEKWPKKITLVLRLRGLEQFAVWTDDKTSVHLSVLSHSGYKQRAGLRKDGKEKTLEKKSPYFMTAKVCDKDGKPVEGLPPEGGYFEIELPAELFKNNPERLFISWIDFYRD